MPVGVGHRMACREDETDRAATKEADADRGQPAPPPADRERAAAVRRTGRRSRAKRDARQRSNQLTGQPRTIRQFGVGAADDDERPVPQVERIGELSDPDGGRGRQPARQQSVLVRDRHEHAERSQRRMSAMACCGKGLSSLMKKKPTKMSARPPHPIACRRGRRPAGSRGAGTPAVGSARPRARHRAAAPRRGWAKDRSWPSETSGRGVKTEGQTGGAQDQHPGGAGDGRARAARAARERAGRTAPRR